MKEMTVKEMYTLKETIAKDLFEGVTYPWEVLPKISSFILEKNPAFLLGMVLISLIVIGKHFVRYHGEKFALLLFGKRLLLGTKEQA